MDAILIVGVILFICLLLSRTVGESRDVVRYSEKVRKRRERALKNQGVDEYYARKRRAEESMFRITEMINKLLGGSDEDE